MRSYLGGYTQFECGCQVREGSTETHLRVRNPETGELECKGVGRWVKDLEGNKRFHTLDEIRELNIARLALAREARSAALAAA